MGATRAVAVRAAELRAMVVETRETVAEEMAVVVLVKAVAGQEAAAAVTVAATRATAVRVAEV